VWERLEDSGHAEYWTGMVITDLDMPRLDGIG
jgi:hypothetical protein